MNKEEIVIRMMEMLRQSEDSKDRAFARMMDGFADMVERAKTVTHYASEEADEEAMKAAGDVMEEANRSLAELIDRFGISEGAEQVE